jgi:C1A family cysteine protease
LCGYDDAINAFKFRNSWGMTYANNGYGYISYDLFKQKYDSAHFWTLYDEDKDPVKLDTISTDGVNSHVYKAFVIVSHPTEQYSPDKITREVKKDEGSHMTKLNELLLAFKTRSGR